MSYDKFNRYSTRAIDGFRDCPIKIVTTKRGPGKTFGMKRLMMEREGVTVWLFRDSGDLKEGLNTWLDDLTLKRDDRTGIVYGIEDFALKHDEASGVLRYKGEVKCLFRCLSMVTHIKHETFTNVHQFVYDEFVPLKNRKIGGIDSEFAALMDILKTVWHDPLNPSNEARIYLFGNPKDFTHEFFRMFRIDPTLGYGIRRTMPGVVWEFLEPPSDMPYDPFSTMTDSVDSNLESWKDASHFVGPLPKGCKLNSTIRGENGWFEMWRDSQGWTWVREGEKGHVPGVLHFGVTDGLRRDEISVDRLKMRQAWLDGHQKGLIRYESLNGKTAFLEMIRP